MTFEVCRSSEKNCKKKIVITVESQGGHILIEEIKGGIASTASWKIQEATSDFSSYFF